MRVTPIIALALLAFALMVLTIYGISIFGSLDASAPINNTSVYSDAYNGTVDTSIVTVSVMSFLPMIFAVLTMIIAIIITVAYIRKK